MKFVTTINGDLVNLENVERFAVNERGSEGEIRVYTLARDDDGQQWYVAVRGPLEQIRAKYRVLTDSLSLRI